MAGHGILGVCALVRRTDGAVLLVRGDKHGWELPGGKVEPGESFAQALARELWEEAGVESGLGTLAGVYQNRFSGLTICGFVCEWRAGVARSSPEMSGEIREARWFAPTQCVEWVTHPAERDRVRDLVYYQGLIVRRVYSLQNCEPGGSARYKYTVHEERWI